MVAFEWVVCEILIFNKINLLYNYPIITGKGRTVSYCGFACFRPGGNSAFAAGGTGASKASRETELLRPVKNLRKECLKYEENVRNTHLPDDLYCRRRHPHHFQIHRIWQGRGRRLWKRRRRYRMVKKLQKIQKGTKHK
jgi:hypothetical protein